MIRIPTAVLVGALGLALSVVGCGRTITASDRAGGPPVTIPGLGVELSGPGAKPTTPRACVERWNGTSNAAARRAIAERVADATGASVSIAPKRGSLSEYEGRCLISSAATQKQAVVFVERARGQFAFVADATDLLAMPNAAAEQDGRLTLESSHRSGLREC